jgi:hypothetical protein
MENPYVISSKIKILDFLFVESHIREALQNINELLSEANVLKNKTHLYNIYRVKGQCHLAISEFELAQNAFMQCNDLALYMSNVAYRIETLNSLVLAIYRHSKLGCIDKLKLLENAQSYISNSYRLNKTRVFDSAIGRKVNKLEYGKTQVLEGVLQNSIELIEIGIKTLEESKYTTGVAIARMFLGELKYNNCEYEIAHELFILSISRFITRKSYPWYRICCQYHLWLLNDKIADQNKQNIIYDISYFDLNDFFIAKMNMSISSRV